jgi:Na+-translocating ferredoxin:NAD+ oxidoreductase RnfD subunit
LAYHATIVTDSPTAYGLGITTDLGVESQASLLPATGGIEMNPELKVSTPSPASPTSPLSVWVRRFCSLDNRYLAPMFITCILAAAQLSFGILESYARTVLAIGTALCIELVLARLCRGQWPHLASAYITGISVGILIRSPAFWPYALCSTMSITSKYVLRVKDRHLWNPSNFGLCVMLFLAADVVASLSVQWGNYLPPMLIVWLLGSVIIWQLRRFHICATYVVSFVLFAGVRSWITGQPFLAEVAPITGPMYQLFIFFMITDPKTTVQTKGGQCLVAFLVALTEMILRLNESVHAPYYALFLVGPSANLLDLWWSARQSTAASSPPLA